MLTIPSHCTIEVQKKRGQDRLRFLISGTFKTFFAGMFEGIGNFFMIPGGLQHYPRVCFIMPEARISIWLPVTSAGTPCTLIMR